MTGTLAEPSLRRVAKDLAEQIGITPVIVVLNIQVAALMTTEWLSRKLQLPRGRRVDVVVLPGYCRGDLDPIARKLDVPVRLGPKDLRDLPAMFGGRSGADEIGPHDIEIIAEINDAARLPLEQLVREADTLRGAGADVIDVGCDPDVERPAWPGVGAAVAALRDRGLRVSVDSFHPREVRDACAAGAELVLSVNSTNRQLAAALGIEFATEVVAVPDTPDDLASLDRTMEYLDRHGVRFRVDPIVEPIGFGFAASLGRYVDVRRRHPEVKMMMGVGNITEMTEVDSAAVNALLIGFCQELGIFSVLTTQVIDWARTAVAEIDLARRVMHHAVSRRTAPKHIDERLVILRDAPLHRVDDDELEALASRLTDRNVRIFADAHAGRVHAMNNRVHAVGDDPFALFVELGIEDPAHAFYLGYEMAKAITAVTLGKNYAQDEALNWGILTRPEMPRERTNGPDGARMKQDDGT